jgi:hypothetical protein
VVASFPLEPATLGHTLLVPTAHVPDIWTLSADQASALAVVTLRVAYAVKQYPRRRAFSPPTSSAGNPSRNPLCERVSRRRVRSWSQQSWRNARPATPSQ